jgi:hypothetical protein
MQNSEYDRGFADAIKAAAELAHDFSDRPSHPGNLGLKDRILALAPPAILERVAERQKGTEK